MSSANTKLILNSIHSFPILFDQIEGLNK